MDGKPCLELEGLGYNTTRDVDLQRKGAFCNIGLFRYWSVVEVDPLCCSSEELKMSDGCVVTRSNRGTEGADSGSEGRKKGKSSTRMVMEEKPDILEGSIKASLTWIIVRMYLHI